MNFKGTLVADVFAKSWQSCEPSDGLVSKCQDPLASALGRWKQEDQEFKASLSYIASLEPVGHMRPYLKNTKREKKKTTSHTDSAESTPILEPRPAHVFI